MVPAIRRGACIEGKREENPERVLKVKPAFLRGVAAIDTLGSRVLPNDKVLKGLQSLERDESGVSWSAAARLDKR